MLKHGTWVKLLGRGADFLLYFWTAWIWPYRLVIENLVFFFFCSGFVSLIDCELNKFEAKLKTSRFAELRRLPWLEDLLKTEAWMMKALWRGIGVLSLLLRQMRTNYLTIFLRSTLELAWCKTSCAIRLCGFVVPIPIPTITKNIGGVQNTLKPTEPPKTLKQSKTGNSW